MTIAILSALPEEQAGLAAALQSPQTTVRAGRTFVQGQLRGVPVVFALSGIGKVAAATTTTLLIEHFGATQVLFTGVAGGVGSHVSVGDVVVAQQFVQHDMDVRPLFPRWQVPGYAQPWFSCDAVMTARLLEAAHTCVQEAATWQLPILQGMAPKVHHGLIASGDQFIVSAEVAHGIRDSLQQAGQQVLAVEMEGAAIAQTCADYGVHFAAVRTISDRADNQAHVDFPSFVATVASRYAHHIVMQWLSAYTPSAQYPR